MMDGLNVSLASPRSTLETRHAVRKGLGEGFGLVGHVPNPYAGINRIRFNGFSRAGPSGLTISGDVPPQRTGAV